MNKMDDNKVYWITGLAGAGKTTIGKKLYCYLCEQNSAVLFLDGDEIREVLQSTDYTDEGRKKLAFQYARLANWLYHQGMTVVVCTVSMYDAVRDWNRKNIPGYQEIYLEIPMEELIQRNQKGLYSNALKGIEKTVCGINLNVELPKTPDLIIKNYGNMTPEMAVALIKKSFNL